MVNFIFQPIRKSMNKEQAIKNLEESKIRDNIKNEFCKNNGITLISIKYEIQKLYKIIQTCIKFDSSL